MSRPSTSVSSKLWKKTKIALFAMDGSTVDYDAGMRHYLDLIRSPDEPVDFDRDQEPPYMEARRKLIQNQPGFWLNLQPLQAGLEIYQDIMDVGFSPHFLTQGPQKAPNAWSEKLLWVQKHFPNVDISITRNKSISYGRILVDDWPDFFLPWLKWRPRGLVIAIKQKWNESYQNNAHPNVVVYDGTNREVVRERIRAAYERPVGRPC